MTVGTPKCWYLICREKKPIDLRKALIRMIDRRMARAARIRLLTRVVQSPQLVVSNLARAGVHSATHR